MRLRPLLVALLVLLVAAPAASATVQYPDLQTLPPRDLRFDTMGSQHLLRFTNTVWNAGEGPLRVTGDIDPAVGTAPAIQRVANTEGSDDTYVIGEYVIHAEHQHFHYDNWGRYELWTKAGYDAWVAAGRPPGTQPGLIGAKTTSCILDEEFIADIPGTPFPRVYNDRGCDPTGTNKIDTGLSVGWGDTYDYDRFDQWINLGTEPLADGEYILRSVADPENKVYESPGKADTTRESVTANEAMTTVDIVGGVIQDLQAPTGTITINDVNDETSTTNVTLRVLGRDDVAGVTVVRLSNDGVTWRENLAYGGLGSNPMTVNWDLADTRYGGSTATGERTVYVQFKDATGKWSPSITDTIELTTGTDPGNGSNSLYKSSVLSDFPVSYWRLGEGTGTAAGDERGANPGTYSGGPTLGVPSLLNSDVDTAVRFTGASWVSIPGAGSLLFSNNVSLEAWIQPDSLPTAGNFASIVTRPEAYALQFNGPLLEFTIIQGTVRKRLQAPAGAIVPGSRYHVVGTYNAQEQRLYVNGALVASAPLTGPANGGWPGLNIGSWDGLDEFFRGTIDEVAVYGSTLTGLQAKQHYDAGASTAVGVSTPTNLAATAPSSSSVNLTWQDNSDNETGFVVERSASNAFTSPTAISLPAGTTSTTMSGLNAGTQYFFRAKAITATDSSAWSGTASATTQPPSAPTGLTATAVSQTAIDLAWTDTSTGERGFVVQRSTSSSFSSPTDLNVAAGQTTLRDTGLTAGTQYWYRVKAVGGGTSASAYSNTANATTTAADPPPPVAPAAPSGLSASATSQTAISLTWTDTSDDETGFVIERSTSSAFTSPTTISVGANTTSRSDTGLTAGTQYWYRVKAVNGTLSSAYSNTANAITHSASTTPMGYPATVAGDGPVSHWRLGETSGTTAADVKAVNPGTYRNSVRLGLAGLITGTDKAIRITNSAWTEVRDSSSLDLTSAFTLEAWIKPDSIPATGGWASVLAKPEAYALQFNGPQLEFTLIQKGTRRRLLAPTGTIVAGNTYHVVATHDGATQRLYVNGSQVASRAQTGAATVVTWPLALGSWNGIAEFFRGTIDEAAVYDKTLTAARVKAHYDAGRATATAASARTTMLMPARTFHHVRAPASALGPAQRLTKGLKGPGRALERRVRSCSSHIAAAARTAQAQADAAHLHGARALAVIRRAKADARKACATARRQLARPRSRGR